MVYNGKTEKPIKIHDLGGFPPIFGNTHIYSWRKKSSMFRGGGGWKIFLVRKPSKPTRKSRKSHGVIEAWRGGIHPSQEYQQAFTSYLGFNFKKQSGHIIENMWGADGFNI